MPRNGSRCCALGGLFLEVMENPATCRGENYWNATRGPGEVTFIEIPKGCTSDQLEALISIVL